MKLKLLKRAKISACLLAISLILPTAFADELDFQSYQDCASFFQGLSTEAQNSTEQNQWEYLPLFIGLIGYSSATYQDNCTNGNCVFTAQIGGCRAIKFSNDYINGVDTNNILWNQLIPIVQTQLTNFYNNVDTMNNINHGMATITCPHTQGQKADIVQCSITLG